MSWVWLALCIIGLAVVVANAKRETEPPDPSIYEAETETVPQESPRSPPFEQRLPVDPPADEGAEGR